MPFITVISFSIHSLSGKNRDNIVTLATLGVFVLPVSKPLLFPCFILDVAQSTSHWLQGGSTHSVKNSSISSFSTYGFKKKNKKNYSFMILFVIREGLKNTAESIAVMLHQSHAGQICSHSQGPAEGLEKTQREAALPWRGLGRLLCRKWVHRWSAKLVSGLQSQENAAENEQPEENKSVWVSNPPPVSELGIATAAGGRQAQHHHKTPAFPPPIAITVYLTPDIHQCRVQFPCSAGTSEGLWCPEPTVLPSYRRPAKSNTDRGQSCSRILLSTNTEGQSLLNSDASSSTTPSL